MHRALVLFMSFAFDSAALAHKAKPDHTHCVVDGTAMESKGKTEALRKKACVDAGGVWDESNTWKVGSKVQIIKEDPKNVRP